MQLRAGSLDRRIRIERPIVDDAPDGAGSAAWAPVATVWAQVQDMLPSRGERLAEGLNIASRPARIRMRFRTDITAAMRVIYGTRIMQIMSVPAQLGRREGLEFVAQDYSTSGGGA